MSKIYCMNCGTPTDNAFAKFCANCGKPYLSKAKTENSPKIPSQLEVEIDEESNQHINPIMPNQDQLGFDQIETIERPVRETMKDLALAQKTGFKREKGNRRNKKQVWEDFKSEAGTSRRTK